MFALTLLFASLFTKPILTSSFTWRARSFPSCVRTLASDEGQERDDTAFGLTCTLQF